MKFSILFSTLLLFSMLSLGAVDYVAVQVDLEWARSEISVQETEINNLDQEISAKNARIEELDSENTRLTSDIDRMNEFLEELYKSAGDLHSLYGATRNAETRRELLERLESNRQQSYALENRKTEYNGMIVMNRRERSTARRKVVGHTLAIEDAQDRINWLNSCVELTESILPGVGNIVSEADDIGSRVNSFLGS